MNKLKEEKFQGLVIPVWDKELFGGTGYCTGEPNSTLCSVSVVIVNCDNCLYSKHNTKMYKKWKGWQERMNNEEG